jgi:hypothetical protein
LYFTGNSASYGGGVYAGTLNNCTLIGNAAFTLEYPVAFGYGGGALLSTLNNCLLNGNSAQYAGGGAVNSTLNQCIISGNSAWNYAGGVASCSLLNCIVNGNSANAGGGGYVSQFTNCTITANSAYSFGGVGGGSIINCIVYYNTARSAANYEVSSTDSVAFCCTTPLPAGPGNIDAAPLFVNTNGWADLRLQSNSPCINAGGNAFAVGNTDLDGAPRIAGARVDMGAYEFQGAGLSGLQAWLWPCGLRIDGSADAVDSDGDGLSNLQEWRCGTDPTNAVSALRLLPMQKNGSDVLVQWQSVGNISYFLERSTNLSSSQPFQPLATNIVGVSGVTTFLDTNTPTQVPSFYRVGVGN